MADAPRFLVYAITDVANMGALLALPPDPRVAIQLRDLRAEGKALYDAASAFVAARHRLYVNDRVDVALAARCEGVHLRARSLSVADVRALAPSLRIGVSTHHDHEIAAAHEQGADFCVFGPIFATPGKGVPLGLPALASAVTRAALPLYALGGVDETNAGACLAAGATGIAAIRAAVSLAMRPPQVPPRAPEARS